MNRPVLPMLLMASIALASVAHAVTVDQITRPRETLSGMFTVSVRSAEPIAINRIHSWIVHVESSEGSTISDVSIAVSGGMPEHDHGMPTAPRMTRRLPDGDYLIEGMKFHMNGRWEVILRISADGLTDSAVFELDL